MDFSNRSAGALLLGAISIAALHALIPSHWLAFAVVGRAQRWTRSRTLAVAAMAGTGHILMTLLLGTILAAAGRVLLKAIPEGLEHAVTAGMLVLLGLYFILAARLGHKHTCSHGADAEAEDGHSHRRGSRTAVGALILGMTLSPCLDLLPVLVAASTLAWEILLVLGLVMAAVTLITMLAMVGLAWRGLEVLNLHWLEHNEGLAVGGVLIALGIVLFFWRG